jgi:Ca2+-binding EF-hand superfamily protein
VIREQRIDITATESDHIFNVFDEQGLDLINFSELMFALRGHIPQNRK